MNEKERLILKLFVENQQRFLTSRELAAALLVSDRTIRNYLQRMKEILVANGAMLIAKQGYGYQIVIEKKEQFLEFYQQETTEPVLVKESHEIHEAKERQYYILNRLFFENKCYTAEEFSNQLFVSYSTITNDLFEIRQLLKKYQLNLRNKTKIGVEVLGEEQNKRNFIMNYFFMNRLFDNFHMFSAYASLLDEVPMNEIIIIVLDECREAQLPISDFIIANIVLHIGLAIKRIQSGFPIEEKAIEIEKKAIEYQTALKILERMKASLGVEFPIAEAHYIALHLQNKLAATQIYQKAQCNEEQIKQQLLTTLKAFDQERGFDFSADQNLINGLLQHFTPLLARLQNHNTIQNPLLREIKQKYRQIYELTVHYFSQMPIFKEYQVSEEEWAYVAIHLVAAVERFFNNRKARVVVVCATGLGSSQVLKLRIEHELGSKLMVNQVLGYYEINLANLEDVDLIISTITLPKEKYPVPVVSVSVFLSEEDIRKVNGELTRLQGLGQIRQKLILASHETQQEKIALIKKCFRPELFFVFQKHLGKEALLTYLAAQIETYEGREIASELLHQLKEREKYGTVAFSPSLAVPHPLEAVTTNAFVAVAVVPKGVYWDEEHAAIELVLLSSPDKGKQVRIEQLNQLFVSIIEDQNFKNQLVNSQTFEEWLTNFIAYL